MRFTFTDEQRLLGRTVSELLEKECPPERVREATTDDGGRRAELWRSLARVGVIGITASDRDGGLGMDEIDAMLPLEACGRAAVPLPVAETVAVAVPALRDHAPEPVRARWLPGLVAGDVSVAVGLGGPVADADVAHVLVLARNDELHVVERADVELRPVRSLDPTRRLFDVAYRAADAVTIGDATAVATARARALLGTSAVLLGVTARLIEVAAGYAKERVQFGKPIGSFQAVKHHLANALLGLEFARPVVYRAAHSVARGVPDRDRDVAMAKAFASDAATAAARIALQVHGAIGYTEESDLHLWLKRAWALSSAYGDASHHRRAIARTVVG